MANTSAQLARLVPDYFYYGTVGLIRPQRFRALSYPEFRSEFSLDEKTIEAWSEIFETGGERVPFMYHWPQFIRYFLRAMQEIGFFYGNVRHLAQDIEIDGAWDMELGKYEVQSRILEFYKRRAGQVVIKSETVVFDANKNQRFRSTDYAIILNVSNKDLAKLDLLEMPEDLTARLSGLKDRPSRLSGLENAEIEKSLQLGEWEGMKFGLISGDLNPIHTHKSMSRFFGMKNPFIQGTWMTNRVIQELAKKEGDIRFQMTFANPLLLEKKHQLKVSDGIVEILDTSEDPVLIAFGQTR